MKMSTCHEPWGTHSSLMATSRASWAEGLGGAKAYSWHGSGWAHQPEMNPRWKEGNAVRLAEASSHRTSSPTTTLAKARPWSESLDLTLVEAVATGRLWLCVCARTEEWACACVCRSVQNATRASPRGPGFWVKNSCRWRWQHSREASTGHTFHCTKTQSLLI